MDILLLSAPPPNWFIPGSRLPRPECISDRTLPSKNGIIVTMPDRARMQLNALPPVRRECGEDGTGG